MNPTFQDLGNGTFNMTPAPAAAQPFDPASVQNQISTLQAQLAAAVQLATDSANAEFGPQIGALQSLLAEFNAAIPNPSQPS